VIGTVILILTVFQMASGYLRPHKGDPPSGGRLVFEFFHHWNGRILLILSIAQITLGIIELGVNNFAYGIWLPFLLILFLTAIILELRMCFGSGGRREDESPARISHALARSHVRTTFQVDAVYSLSQQVRSLQAENREGSALRSLPGF